MVPFPDIHRKLGKSVHPRTKFSPVLRLLRQMHYEASVTSGVILLPYGKRRRQYCTFLFLLHRVPAWYISVDVHLVPSIQVRQSKLNIFFRLRDVPQFPATPAQKERTGASYTRIGWPDRDGRRHLSDAKHRRAVAKHPKADVPSPWRLIAVSSSAVSFRPFRCVTGA